MPNDLTPELRFPEFEDEWNVKKLGKIVNFFTTNSFSRALLTYDSGEVKNIHYGDIHTKFNSSFSVSEELVPYINEEVALHKIPQENYCQVGDLIIADASEDYKDIGKSIEIVNTDNQKILAGLHTILARDKDDSNALGFKSYLMQSDAVRKQIMTMATGVSVLGVSKGNLAKLEITIPSKPEQTKIANFLTAVDEKIKTLTKKKTLLEEYKKGVMQRLFSQAICFKDEQGQDFPDWEDKKLGDTGKFFSGGTPKSTNKSFYDGEIPFIKSGELNSTETEQFLSEIGFKKSSAKMVCKGDLLFALYGATSGECAISKIEGAINQAVLCIRTDFNNYFLLSFLKSNKENIKATYLQGGQGNLSADIVKSLIVPYPSLPEQQKIADFLTALDEKINKAAQQIETAQAFKKGLLQKMFV